MHKYLLFNLGIVLALFVTFGVVTWIGGFPSVFCLMLGISAAWGISWDRARGKLGIVAGILWGAIGAALGAFFMAALDPSFPGLLQGYAYPIMSFGGAIVGAILALLVALCGVLIQNRRDYATRREFPKPKEAVRLGTLAFAVIWVFGGILVAGQWLNLDFRPHLRPAITLKGYHGHVSLGSFAPDSRTLATVDFHGTVSIWDLTTRSIETEMQGSVWHNFAPVAFSPDGKTLASGGEDGVIKLWDPANGHLRGKLIGKQGDTSCLLFSPNGQKLFAASGTFPTNGQIKIWDLESQRQVATFTKQQMEGIRSLSISPDGRILAVPEDGLSTVLLLDGNTLTELFSLKGHRVKVSAVAFSPDGKLLASGGGGLNVQTEIFIWDVTTGKKISELNGHGRGITGLAFSPDGLSLASASYDDTTIWLWDVSTRQRRFVLKGLWGDGSPPVTGFAFSPDGYRLCASDSKGTVIVWNLER
jgi:dipeptidyl aminopeptidase/acylaminoacyl peptidase